MRVCVGVCVCCVCVCVFCVSCVHPCVVSPAAGSKRFRYEDQQGRPSSVMAGALQRRALEAASSERLRASGSTWVAPQSESTGSELWGSLVGNVDPIFLNPG